MNESQQFGDFIFTALYRGDPEKMWIEKESTGEGMETSLVKVTQFMAAVFLAGLEKYWNENF